MVFASGVSGVGRCAVAGCLEPVCARDLCRKHYDRDRRSGSPVRPVRRRMCPVCFSWFEPGRVDKLFCSSRCRLRYHRLRVLNPGLPERPDTGLHVAPVAPEGFEPSIRVEEFTRSQVVEKCGGCCYWCGAPVDFESSGAFGPFFEWKVPVEKSREATLENRILVHNRCAGGRPRRRVSARKGRERGVSSGGEQSSGR